MKQIEEDYVSFETAKLLIEKEYDIGSSTWYNEQGEKGEYGMKGKFKLYCSRPTQALVLKWLRVKYDIHIEIHSCNNNGKVFFTGVGFDISKGARYVMFPTQLDKYDLYEEATEAAIKHCLEHLIK